MDNIKLPSSVFASEVEEDVGLLNKAATQGKFLFSESNSDHTGFFYEEEPIVKTLHAH